MAAAVMQLRDQAELRIALSRLGVENGIQTQLYTIRRSRGRGQGVFARQEIQEGALILQEQPMLSIQGAQDPLTRANTAAIRQAVQGINAFGQLYCPPDDPDDSKPEYFRRFVVNSFQMGPEVRGRSQQGIFLEASRFNHSCIPSAHFAWNEPLGRLTIHAIFPIAQGEEILLNYRVEDCYELRNVRQDNLLSRYGFHCDCRACIGQSQFGRESEERRREMKALKTEIESPLNNRWGAPATVRGKRLENVVDLRNKLDNEGLRYPPMAEVLGWEADLYRAELSRNQRDAIIHIPSCRARALAAAREELFLDVMACGHNSDETRESLADVRNI